MVALSTPTGVASAEDSPSPPNDADAPAARVPAAATLTPYHPFTCREGMYAVFQLKADGLPTVAAADFGLLASGSSGFGLPSIGEVMVADQQFNLQIDVCFVGETPHIQRVTAALPQLRSMGGGFTFVDGRKVSTFIFTDLVTEPRLGAFDAWAYLMLPRQTLRDTGLAAALLGDMSGLDFSFPISAQETLHLRAIARQGVYVAGWYGLKSEVQDRASTSFILTGRIEVGSAFSGFLRCRMGFQPEEQTFQLGSATLETHGCHRYTRTAGSDHSYSWHKVVLTDNNPELQPEFRGSHTLEGEILGDRIDLDVQHHNFSDSLVIRMPGAVYACYLGSVDDPTHGRLPSDIPLALLASPEGEQPFGEPCVVRYGEDGPWTAMRRTRLVH